MNGRMYDPLLGRFLSPDPYVQTPGYSQIYNRYAYGFNNPMSFVDPSGEIAWFIPMIIGAAINVATNGISNLQNGEKFFKGAGRSAAMGAISGLISFGIGEITSGMVGIEKIISQTLLHSYAGAASAIANGSDVGAGALAGALGSLASAGTGALLQKANGALRTIGTIASGGVMGGVGSVIAGGDFISGFKQGLISSSLNCAMHFATSQIQDAMSQTQGLSKPTIDSKSVGGIFNNYDEFFDFMVDMATNNPDEVAALALNVEMADGTIEKRYWVNRWDENTKTNAYHYDSDMPTNLGGVVTIVAEYHTHTVGTYRHVSYGDAIFAQKYQIPVHAISRGGEVWRVNKFPKELIIPHRSQERPFGRRIR